MTEAGTNDDILEFLVRASGTAGSTDRTRLHPGEPSGLSPRGFKKQPPPPVKKVPWYQQRPDIKMLIALILLALIIALALLLSYLTTPKRSETIHAMNPERAATPLYRFASVAGDPGICSEVGTVMLARGGSAVDAAIASVSCGSVIHMQSAGIGGGFFMVVWNARTQKAFTIDAREVAPLAYSDESFKNRDTPFAGPYSVGVPGEIAGLWEAHQRFGRLPWHSLFQPAIELCKKGFTVTKALGDSFEGNRNMLLSKTNNSIFDGLRKLMTNPATGSLFKPGDKIYCPNNLAKTLERIAVHGGPDYYNGSLADDIVQDLKDLNVPITKEDLSKYRAIWREPLVTELKGNMHMYSMRPPGSGAILGYILNILRGYNFTPADLEKPLTYHRIVEAIKFGYGKRLYLGDESFVTDQFTADLVKNLTDPAFAEATRLLINDSMAQPLSHYGPIAFEKHTDFGTTQVSILAGDGSAVSMTSTINLIMGSGLVGSRTGIIFNNELDDFFSNYRNSSYGTPANAANFAKPGKRPMSAMCPAIMVVNNTAVLALGAAGGMRITSATAYVAARVLLFGDTIKQAIESPRFHHQRSPEKLVYEPNMPRVLLDYLRKLGHKNIEQTGAVFRSVVQGVQRLENGSIMGISDQRKDTLYADGF